MRNSYNPNSDTAGFGCIKCPEFTYASEDGASCQFYDSILSSKHDSQDWRDEGEKHMYHLSQLPKILSFCISNPHSPLCHDSSFQLGPIFPINSSDHKTRRVFYLSDRQPLITSDFSFHQSRVDSVGLNNHSYVYMLFQVQNATVQELRDYLELKVSGV